VSTPPHNPLKAPLFAIGAVALLVLAAQEWVTGAWFVICVALAALDLICLGVILSGRHPRWLRAPADRWWARRRGTLG
jgi:threonine/homoserine/homoserine lactone efflux protein